MVSQFAIVKCSQRVPIHKYDNNIHLITFMPFVISSICITVDLRLNLCVLSAKGANYADEDGANDGLGAI